MKKKDRLPPFTPTPNDLIDSEAYKKLSNAARVAYLLLCRQKKRFDQVEVKFPYSQAATYMDRHTWSKAIKDLISVGLVTRKQEGGLYRRINIYGISIWGAKIHTVEKAVFGQTSVNNHTVDFL